MSTPTPTPEPIILPVKLVWEGPFTYHRITRGEDSWDLELVSVGTVDLHLEVDGVRVNNLLEGLYVYTDLKAHDSREVRMELKGPRIHPSSPLARMFGER